MELIVEVLFEFVLQAVLEILAELGVHKARAAAARRPNPWMAALGYTVMGGVAGVISLAIFPALFAHSETAQITNLVLTPILAGSFMLLMGAWRRRRGDEPVGFDRFACGYLFALAMALVRFNFGE